MTRDPSIPSPSDWGRFIKNAVTDWNGAAMQDGEAPRVVPNCGELRALAADYAALAASHQSLKDALAELVRIRDWVALAGGCEGPLPQDVIQKFAEQQFPAIEAARAALKDAP